MLIVVARVSQNEVYSMHSFDSLPKSVRFRMKTSPLARESLSQAPDTLRTMGFKAQRGWHAPLSAGR